MTARWITADVFDGLATLDDGSVDLVITSPPFLALRSYLPADHPDKGKEIGSEPTPAAFIDVMLAVTAELRRVLAPHGSIAIELGDTYAGSGGAGGDYIAGGWREGQEGYRQHYKERVYDPKHNNVGIYNMNGKVQGGGKGWPLAKSKTLIPELYRLALAYGINPLTGQPSPAGKWRVRNVVTWCRPNPPVGALGDKWRPATSDIVIACTSDKRYWDDIATRKPHRVAPEDRKPQQRDASRDVRPNGTGGQGLPLGAPSSGAFNNEGNPAGAPLLDYWELPPGGYPGSHYAVYPPALVEPLIKAMAPPKVCETCGEPSRRITGFNPSLRESLPLHLRDRREAAELTLPEVSAWFDNKHSVRDWERDDGKHAVPPLDTWDLLSNRLNLDPAYRAVFERQSLVSYVDKNGQPIPERASHGYNRGGGTSTLGRVDASRVADSYWSDCGHDNWRPAHILDPFAGSGTTLAVATGHGHTATGIDLDERNRDLALERIGPFLFEEVDASSAP